MKYFICFHSVVYIIYCVNFSSWSVESFPALILKNALLPALNKLCAKISEKESDDERIILSKENSRRYDLKTIGAIIASQSKLDGYLNTATVDFLASEKKMAKMRLPGDFDAQVKKISDTFSKSTVSNQLGVISSLLLANKGGNAQVKRRSEILDALLTIGNDRNIASYSIKIKLTKDYSRYQREIINYQNIVGSQGLRGDKSNDFVRFYCYSSPVASNTGSGGEYAIYMESGEICLREAAASVNKNAKRNIPSQKLRLQAVKVAALAMVNVLDTIHSKGLVWGDFKLDNFVLVPTAERKAEVDQQILKNLKDKSKKSAVVTDYLSLIVSGRVRVKAIDLESFTPRGEPLRDFSAETLAPEHAVLISQGSLKMVAPGDFKLDLLQPILADPKADIFALGVELLHLYSGRSPIAGRSLQSAVRQMQDYDACDAFIPVDLSESWKRLLSWMLDPDPSKRPDITTVRFVLFFLSPFI